MKTNNTSPIIESNVQLSYSSGLYRFFTMTCAKLFTIVMAFFASMAGTDPEAMKPAAFSGLVNCIWIVNHMARKLEGISSISSSVHDNCFCKARMMLQDCICMYCYAYNQQAYQTGLKEHNIINGLVLRNVLIPVKAFKKLMIVFPYLRIESFGDVANVTQARNYIRIIKAFPEKRCAIWSKNIAIYEQAFKLEGKPRNTTYVHSSRALNKPDDIDLNRYDFVDHIFTVYTKRYIKKHNVVINCGGKKCMECIKQRKNCYFRLNDRNNTLYINEEKK